MCAIVPADNVQSPTRTPSRAAAYAASQPAWPAPMTMTSNRSFTKSRQLAKTAEQRGNETFSLLGGLVVFPAVVRFATQQRITSWNYLFFNNLLVLMRHFDPGFDTPGLSVQYSLAAAHDRWSANVLGLLNARFVEHAPAAQ